MNIICLKIGKKPYPPIQSWNGIEPPDGYVEFPDQFLSTFYPVGKRFGGFVDIIVENNVITSCTWDDDSYQSYASAHPEDLTPPPEEESTVWDELDAAYREGVASAYDS